MDNSNLRNSEEIRLAHQSLADAFYPRRVYGDKCEQCGATGNHAVACDVSRTSAFQGWETLVMKTRTPEGECGVPECRNNATIRIRLNTWGVLGEYDVCEAHSRYSDGKSRDLTRCDSL